MKYGICHLSIVPMRANPEDLSELVSQLLYGEVFKIIDQRKKWIKVRCSTDDYTGWIDRKQYRPLNAQEYTKALENTPVFSSDLVDFVSTANGMLKSIVVGSSIHNCAVLGDTFEGQKREHNHNNSELIIEQALMYLGSPYLWGGKTPFGIDCSGLTQMVYRLSGKTIPRDAKDQALLGETLSFIEESKPGNLAFFDNSEGKIIHVGLIMKDNYILHAHGEVRIDRLDQTGIFNTHKNTHTHKLRVIKKIK
jgi:cell wall-associated NlpC family hydrolase